MKLKNEALEKLYDDLMNSNIVWLSPCAEAPADKMFKECDKKLSESVTFEQLKNLQDHNDILEKSNGTLLDANLDLCSKNRDLKDRIKQLEKDLDEAKSSVNYFKASRDDWRSRAKHEEEEKIELAEQVNKALGEKFRLQREVEQLKKDRDIWVRNNGEKLAEIAELKNRLDKANADRTEQQKNLDYYMDIYKKVQDDYDDLHKKYSERQATVDKQAEQIRQLKNRQDNVSKNCYDQGQTDLWVKLQDVNDVKPWNISSFYPDVSSMDDLISWDMEDFLDEYKKWQDQKETDRMRNWLVEFCDGRVCEGCPLESSEYKCGCGYSFRRVNFFDTRIIPDKDIKRYYEKVDKDLFEKLCGMKSEEEKTKPGNLVVTTRGILTGNYTEETIRAIKEAVRKLEKSLPALESWESTITGSIKVDDILGKTDGTEREFEYGDAVRVPWRDYDYMYIGPDKRGDGKMIRLFDPENHSVAYVSSNEHLDIRGYKIIIGNEEDLRKIWCDKDADKE